MGKLLYINQKRLGLSFTHYSFRLIDLNNQRLLTIIDTFQSTVKRLMCFNRGCIRFFRLEPQCVEKIGESIYVVCYSHRVWTLNLINSSFSEIQKSREGFSNPLNLCSNGKCAYWGDYGDNPRRESVNIYRLNQDLKVEVVYSFPQGAIRHIHNIIWDESQKKFYILTGDLEETSGIYESDSEWEVVRPVVMGSQQYRAVVGFPYKNGLIYATDSVSEKNQIYLLQNGEIKPLAPFPGSCIYGTETKDYYVFSSTVEPPEGRGFFNLFTYKLGKGIKDRYAHIITVRKSDLKVEEVYKAKKDIWPMKLFQYGTFMFPKGQNESNDLFFNVVACKGDGKTQQIHLG